MVPDPGQYGLIGNRVTQLTAWLENRHLRFKSIELLNLCFIHNSWANENELEPSHLTVGNNQRLEFLGDSVLGMAIAGWLYENYPEKAEGELAKIKSYLASAEYLAPIAQSQDLGTLLLLGKGEENSGGRVKKNILADTLEAFFGAYFIDQGWEAAKSLILKWLDVRVGWTESLIKDFKSSLQELCLKLYREFPRYELIATSGPEHRKVFQVGVWLQNKKLAEGVGPSKKQAEQEAAARAWRILRESNS